jgi:hypothetical protein
MSYIVQLADGSAKSVVSENGVMFSVNYTGDLRLYDGTGSVLHLYFSRQWLSIMNMNTAYETLRPRSESGMQGVRYER